MRLIHYSDAFLQAVESRPANGRADGSKPDGLWVSVDGEDDWKSWCEGEDFRLERLTHATEVVLTPAANILHIRTSADLLMFHREYKTRPAFSDDPRFASDHYWDNHAIQWGRVADLYDGIVIAPYQWSLRFDRECPWYYVWDCASGCIWNASAVERLNPVTAAIAA